MFFFISQLPLFFFLTFHVINPLITPSCSSYTLINHLLGVFFSFSVCFLVQSRWSSGLAPVASARHGLPGEAQAQGRRLGGKSA